MFNWMHRLMPKKAPTKENVDKRNSALAREITELRLGKRFVTEEDIAERIEQLKTINQEE